MKIQVEVFWVMFFL